MSRVAQPMPAPPPAVAPPTTAAAPPIGGGIKQLLLRRQRRQAIPVIVVPALAVLFTVVARRPVSAFDLALFAVLYAASMLGITVGFHRLLAHGAFSTAPRLRALLIALGCLAAEGPPLIWVANHRLHHQKSDQEGDPHSPRPPRARRLGGLRGLWHAHIGWMLTAVPADVLRYAPDVLRDPIAIAVNRRYLRLVLLGLAAPAALGWLVPGGAGGLVDGLLWGGLLRLFAVQHVTWCINSICHVFGGRPFDTRDDSRNNGVLGLLAFGEGWHNNHHAAPTSAAHGLRWWQVDISYGFIAALARLGLATDVRRADLGRLARRDRAGGGVGGAA